MNSFMERQAKKKADRLAAQQNKNDNDFVHTTNQWLGKLDGAVHAIKQEVTAHVAETHSMIKMQDIAIENLNTKFDWFKKEVSKQMDDFRQKVSLCTTFIKEGADKVETNVQSIQLHNDIICELSTDYGDLCKHVRIMFESMQQEINRVRQKIDDKAECVKREMSSVPSELPQMKKEITQVLDAYRVDFKGVFEDLLEVKKSLFIRTKHIEDLYTQIKRLQEKK